MHGVWEEGALENEVAEARGKPGDHD